MGPYRMHSSVTSHHSFVIHMIYLANQNDLGGRPLQTRQDAANPNEMRHGCTDIVVTSR